MNTITKVIEQGEREFEEEFVKEPVCKHGNTRGHYTCEPHDYPHVLGNRFGPDCEVCSPPPKPTVKDIKSHLRQSQLALLQAVVEMVEEIGEQDHGDDLKTNKQCSCCGTTLEEVISSLTTIIKELDNKK